MMLWLRCCIYHKYICILRFYQLTFHDFCKNILSKTAADCPTGRYIFSKPATNLSIVFKSLILTQIHSAWAIRPRHTWKYFRFTSWWLKLQDNNDMVSRTQARSKPNFLYRCEPGFWLVLQYYKETDDYMKQTTFPQWSSLDTAPSNLQANTTFRCFQWSKRNGGHRTLRPGCYQSHYKQWP